MTRGRLSNQEKYCIEKKSEEGCSCEEIAEFIGRTEAAVSKHLNKTSEASEVSDAKPAQILKPQFINKTVGKKKGVSIMTEAESFRGEDLKKLREAKKINSKMEPYIHRITNGEKED